MQTCELPDSSIVLFPPPPPPPPRDRGGQGDSSHGELASVAPLDLSIRGAFLQEAISNYQIGLVRDVYLSCARVCVYVCVVEVYVASA